MKKLLIILVLIVSSVSASWMTENDPDVNHWDHIKTAALCYSGTDLTALGYVARHYDVIVLYNNSAWMDTVKAHNDSIKALRYLTLSSIRAEDWDTIPGWAIDRSLTNEDSVYLWVESDSTVITGAGGTCDDGPTITVSINGDTVSFCGWAENRVMADFRKSITQDYFRWKPFWRMDLNADGDADDWKDYQGVFEDEAHWYHGKHHMMFPLRHTTDDSTNWINTTTWQDVNGWDTENWREIFDSMIVLACDSATGTGWFSDQVDTLHDENKMYIQNIVNYGLIENDNDIWWRVKNTGNGVIVWENSISSISYQAWNPMAWDWMDKIIEWDTGYAIIWTSITSGEPTTLDSLQRCQMFNLVWYYMAANPDRFYFMMAGNEVAHPPNDYKIADTLEWRFPNVVAYDIGTPDGARTVQATGTDGEGQSFTIYKREYTRGDGRNVEMYFRDNEGTSYGATTAETVNLTGNWQIINADSSLSSTVTSVDIMNVHGIMLLGEEVGEVPSKIKRSTIRGAVVK